MPNKSAPFQVIALGLNAVDVLVRLPAKVVPDAKHMVDDLIIQGGAPVGSGSSALARLGYRTAFAGRLGQNTLSDISVEEFRKCGVSTDLIIRDENSRPAIALVEIHPETAARTVFVNLDNYGRMRAEDIPAAEIRQAKVLMVDSYDLDAAENALQAARGSACRTLLDFESGDAERMKRLLPLGTDALLPLECARILSGKKEPEAALEAAAGMTPGQAVITDGENGSWAWQAGGILHQPAFKVAELIDSTGCGDAFHAGYAAGLLEGWPLPMRMEFGALLASRVLTRVGGRSALPRRSELAGMVRPEVSASLKDELLRMSNEG